MIINLYKINPDNTFGGVEESHSDVDIDLASYTAPKGYTFVSPPDETYKWNGAEWVGRDVYGPTLDELKEMKKHEISVSFEQYVAGRIAVSSGWEMQFDQRDISMVDGAIRYMEMTQTVSGYLTDADNVNHYDLAIAAMKQVLLEMIGAYMAAHAKKQILRSQIDACNSEAELEVLSWSGSE